MSANRWDPGQYERFERERAQPFHDLVGLVAPCPGGRVVDLGCGPGTRTVELVDLLQAAEVLGLDHSVPMLERAEARQTDRVRFEARDVATFDEPGRWDVVFSNAALHWVEGHDDLFARLARALAPGGQLAVQMPVNFDHPASAVAAEVVTSLGLVDALGGRTRGAAVDPPQRYAERLYDAGLEDIHVHVRVYLHELPSRESVIEWTKGSTLGWYQRHLAPADFDRFMDAYRTTLLTRLRDVRPFPFTFKRLFIRGRRKPGV